MKIPNKRKTTKIYKTSNFFRNHLSDIDCDDFMKIYEKINVQPYSILVNYTTIFSDNPSRFICNPTTRLIFTSYTNSNHNNWSSNKKWKSAIQT